MLLLYKLSFYKLFNICHINIYAICVFHTLYGFEYNWKHHNWWFINIQIKNQFQPVWQQLICSNQLALYQYKYWTDLCLAKWKQANWLELMWRVMQRGHRENDSRVYNCALIIAYVWWAWLSEAGRVLLVNGDYQLVRWRAAIDSIWACWRVWTGRVWRRVPGAI